MALPPRYDSIKAYLEDALDFLKDYHWLYSTPNTHILVNTVFERFPCEWLLFLKDLSAEQLNSFVVGVITGKRNEYFYKNKWIFVSIYLNCCRTMHHPHWRIFFGK
jgi:hypothetical protein